MQPSKNDAEFAARLAAAASLVEARLGSVLADAPENGGIYRPPRLVAAMRHAVLAGGKRFRPFLLMETARLFGLEPARSVPAATALECMHSYSLVHDDLPCMDDDDFRRGAPTVHRAFDEATAVLAGDALQALAFELLARPEAHADAAVRVELVGILARAAGLEGMAGGQMLDLQAEKQALDEADVRRLQAMKTGALIAAACEMGAVLGEAAPEARRALKEFGQNLGLAFQIADDLLDAESSAAELGKATAKDSGRGKATFVSLFGKEGARALLTKTVKECERSLSGVGGDTSVLGHAARFAAERKK